MTEEIAEGAAAPAESATATTETTGTAGSTATEGNSKPEGGASTEGSASGTTIADTGDTKPEGALAETKTDDKAAVEQTWRDRMAGEDKAFRKRLDRFATEGDFAKSFRSLEQRLSSGEYKKGLPEGASADEVAAWRKENGVPDKAEAYEYKSDKGFVPGEGDKPVLGLFAQFAHANNMKPEEYSKTLDFYYEVQDAQQAMRVEKDQTFKVTAEDTLRNEYGADFRRNMNVLGTVRESMPSELKTRLLAGRLSDGTLAGNDPDLLRWLISLGHELHPGATLVPAGTNVPSGVASRLDEIRTFRRSNPDGYEADKGMQAEELQLIEADQKIKGRAA